MHITSRYPGQVHQNDFQICHIFDLSFPCLIYAHHYKKIDINLYIRFFYQCVLIFKKCWIFPCYSTQYSIVRRGKFYGLSIIHFSSIKGSCPIQQAVGPLLISREHHRGLLIVLSCVPKSCCSLNLEI